MTSSNLAAGFTYEILLVDKTGPARSNETS
jgi:hypothetical protein